MRDLSRHVKNDPITEPSSQEACNHVLDAGSRANCRVVNTNMERMEALDLLGQTKRP